MEKQTEFANKTVEIDHKSAEKSWKKAENIDDTVDFCGVIVGADSGCFDQKIEGLLGSVLYQVPASF